MKLESLGAVRERERERERESYTLININVITSLAKGLLSDNVKIKGVLCQNVNRHR